LAIDDFRLKEKHNDLLTFQSDLVFNRQSTINNKVARALVEGPTDCLFLIINCFS